MVHIKGRFHAPIQWPRVDCWASVLGPFSHSHVKALTLNGTALSGEPLVNTEAGVLSVVRGVWRGDSVELTSALLPTDRRVHMGIEVALVPETREGFQMEPT